MGAAAWRRLLRGWPGCTAPGQGSLLTLALLALDLSVVSAGAG